MGIRNVDQFEEFFDACDPSGSGKLTRDNIQRFLNMFIPNARPEDERDEESDDFGNKKVTAVDIIKVKYYTESLCKIIWEGLDLDRVGYIDKSLAEYLIHGLAGHIPDFTMKLFFRLLDRDRDGVVNRNECRRMKTLLGKPVSEEEMLNRIEKKIGYPITTLDYPAFSMIFKNKECDPKDSAYEEFPKYFQKEEEKEIKTDGGCCLIL